MHIRSLIKLSKVKVDKALNMGGYKIENIGLGDSADDAMRRSEAPTPGAHASFGDGSDGDVDINSGTFSSGPITSNALTRDAYFDDLTLSGGDLDCAGYRLFVKGTLTINAGYKIHRNGNDASGTTPGAALSAGSLGGSGAGGAAGTSGVAGDPGGSQDPSLGGNGGAGGNGRGVGASSGGAAGTVTAPTAAKGGFRSLPSAITLKEIETTVAKISGGAGGGGGGFGDGLGGAGGGGGGVVVICAKTIDNSSGTISANGGNGGNVASDNAGRGGGGGGGIVVLIYNTLIPGTEQANGGARGDTDGQGGVNGSAGTVIKIANA